jgi:hypothetical protein
MENMIILKKRMEKHKIHKHLYEIFWDENALLDFYSQKYADWDKQ